MIPKGRSERLRPEDRLRKKADFDGAYASGERVPSRSFTLIARPAERNRPRLGLTVSRAVGNSVTRNAVRRRLREAFRRHRDAMSQALDIVIHVRPGAASATYVQLETELLRALGRYAERRRRES